MSLKGLYRRRRFAAALALVGMAFYAVLLPWHTVSQATNALVGSGLGITAELPCHNISAALNGEPKGSPPRQQDALPDLQRLRRSSPHLVGCGNRHRYAAGSRR